MRGPLVRITRKIQSVGLVPTIRALLSQLILLEFLIKPPTVDFLHERFELPTVDKADYCISRREWEFEGNVTIPDKIWIRGTKPIEDAETYSIPEPKLYRYEGCYVFAPSGLGITDRGEVIPDTVASELAWERNRYRTWVPKLIHDHGLRTTHRYINRTPRIEQYDFDEAFPLFPYWLNYYHWTAECLPKLLWLNDDVLNDPTVLIPADPPTWMTQSLELLGVDDYVEVNNGLHTVDQLIVPTYPEPSPEGAKWFRETALSNVDDDLGDADRIYISRENANRRRVANRAEIMAVLSDYGFESVVLEDLVVEEQAALFATAEIVVGPHGAGFTNLMYARETSVIELFGRRKKLTFYRLAKILGFEYQAITGENVPPDIRVDPDELRNVIEHVLD